jgi:hypothetical protein
MMVMEPRTGLENVEVMDSWGHMVKQREGRRRAQGPSYMWPCPEEQNTWSKEEDRGDFPGTQAAVVSQGSVRSELKSQLRAIRAEVLAGT